MAKKQKQKRFDLKDILSQDVVEKAKETQNYTEVLDNLENPKPAETGYVDEAEEEVPNDPVILDENMMEIEDTNVSASTEDKEEQKEDITKEFTGLLHQVERLVMEMDITKKKLEQYEIAFKTVMATNARVKEQSDKVPVLISRVKELELANSKLDYERNILRQQNAALRDEILRLKGGGGGVPKQRVIHSYGPNSSSSLPGNQFNNNGYDSWN